MRQWVVTDSAAGDGLVLEEAATDEPGAALVVEVAAAGVGFPDALMRHGRFQIRQPEPFVLGWEAAGTVVRAPSDGRLAVGDRVATLSFGAYAERLAADPNSTFRLPDSWSFAEGAAFPLNWFTALAALRRARVATGDTVLVTGAAGGVGSTVVQLAAALGAEVIALVSSAEKAQVAEALGAAHALRSDVDWRAELQRLHPRGVRAVIDQVGGPVFGEGLRSLASEGTYVVVGFADGQIPSIEVNRLLLRNASISGVTWSVLAEHPGGLTAAADELFELAERSGLRPFVGERFAFTDLEKALGRLDARTARGKLVLEGAWGSA